MPKREITHSVGQPISEELKGLLTKYFSEAEARKLERLGGRVTIAVTAPYSSRKRGRTPIEINQQFVERLERARTSSNGLLAILKELTVKELRELSKLMGQPLRSSDTAEHIRMQLVRYIQAEDVWQKISGSAKG